MQCRPLAVMPGLNGRSNVKSHQTRSRSSHLDCKPWSRPTDNGRALTTMRPPRTIMVSFAPTFRSNENSWYKIGRRPLMGNDSSGGQVTYYKATQTLSIYPIPRLCPSQAATALCLPSLFLLQLPSFEVSIYQYPRITVQVLTSTFDSASVLTQDVVFLDQLAGHSSAVIQHCSCPTILTLFLLGLPRR